MGGIDFMNLEVSEFGWSIANLDFRVIYLLLILMLIDIITGMVKAWQKGNLWSRKGMFGFMRKVLILLVVVAAAVLDEILKMDGVVSGATLLFFCISEGISIVENAEEAGVPVPAVLKDKLHVAKDEKDRSFQDDLKNEFTDRKDDIG